MCALIDPGFDCGDLLVAEPAVHRHGWPFETGDSPVQPAFFRLAGDNRCALVATLQCGIERPQVELRKLQCFAMTFPATVLEDRLNVLRERDRLLGSGQGAG